LTTMERSSPLGMPEEIGGSSILARKAWFFDFQLGDEFVSIHGVSPAGDILSHWTGIVLHSRRPATRRGCGPQAKSKRPLRSHWLLVRAIEDGLGTFDQFEIGGHCEQGNIRIGTRDVRKLEGLLAHARIASLTVNDGLEIR
jgi:hypothetical protein